MPIFVTYCSADKDPASGELPAIARYRSERIRAVRRAADALGVGFVILSGKYGLIPPHRAIPWYDHLLTAAEAPVLAGVVAGQLRALGVSRILYVTRPVAADATLEPYLNVIASAAGQCALPLCTLELAAVAD